MRVAIRSLILILCLVLPELLHAQQKHMSVKAENLSLSAFFPLLETQSDYRFYFDPQVTDTVQVQINAEQQTLEQILDQVLPEGMYFSTDRYQRVFVTSGTPLMIGDVLVPEVYAELVGEAPVDSVEVPLPIENRLLQYGTEETAQAGPKVITGYVRDLANGNPIGGATVQLAESSLTVQTDQYGYYVLPVENERVTLRYSVVGRQETVRQLLVYENAQVNVQLAERVYALNEIVVTAEQGSNVNSAVMGLDRINIQMVKQTPNVLGEADVIRYVLNLPGVVSMGESATGLHVRGGAADQNLILFNGATIFNPSHFFGFFSAFNADVVNHMELYKSSIPPKFGGRISSVIDISAREGTTTGFTGSGGIGLLTSRLTLEGALGDKTSVLLGGRSTYSNWLMKFIPDERYKNSRAGFFDGNLHLSHRISDDDHLNLTAYFSRDQFSFHTDTAYDYQNRNVNLNWRHVIDTRTYTDFSIGYDGYHYTIQGRGNPSHFFDHDFGVHQGYVRANASHRLDHQHNLTYGLNVLYHKLHPGSLRAGDPASLVTPVSIAAEQALETAVYMGDSYEVTDDLLIDVGLRYSMFNYLGPRQVARYSGDGLPRSSNLEEVTDYGQGAFIQTYHGPEFRLSTRYLLSMDNSLKFSYNSMRQYLHMLSNTTLLSPLDSWKLSDRHIKPQVGQQVSLGYYHNFDRDLYETSVELYYKKTNNHLDFRSGAQLQLNEFMEREVIPTEANAYGVEVLLRKSRGRLNGALSYTYSHARQRVLTDEVLEQINQGNYYPSNHDIPHAVNLLGNYKFSHRFSISTNVVYSSGRPITLPVGVYRLANSERVQYSERNQYRIPYTFRWDVSMNIEGNHRVRKLAHSSWTVGVYNVTGRSNPYSVFYRSEGGSLNSYQLSIFGHQIPYVTYNFSF